MIKRIENYYATNSDTKYLILHDEDENIVWVDVEDVDKLVDALEQFKWNAENKGQLWPSPIITDLIPLQREVNQAVGYVRPSMLEDEAQQEEDDLWKNSDWGV